MATKRTMTLAGLILLGTFLVAGFFGILDRRFAEGGLYPFYASYRPDPMGTSVLYETLERLPGLVVSRNVKSLSSIEGLDAESVVLLLGYPRDGFDSLRAPGGSPVMDAVSQGARLVITVNPELVPEAYRPELSEMEEEWSERRRRLREERARRIVEERTKKKGEESEKEEEKTKAEKEKEDEEEDEEAKLDRQMESMMGPLLTKKLGFDFTVPKDFKRPDEGWETVAGETVSPEGVPAALPDWRSQYRFEIEDGSWKAAVLVGEEPVVIERPYGKGTVVLASDSYFASNESLHLGGEPDFLLWLLGGKSKVVFDETIHGTVETGGAMKLIRRYRAHGVFYGLLLFLALWVWRSASSLVPGSDELDQGLVATGGAVQGEETGSGFIRLLRRSVPPSALLGQCVEVWKGSLAASTPPDTANKIAALVEAQRRDPKRAGIVESYAAIAALLRKRSAEGVDKPADRRE